MSDHDRGAYTPHNEAPLQFDARRSGGRRVFPTTLLLSLVILIGLCGAIYMFYRSGVRAAGQAPAPVGQPVGDIKSPPPAGAAAPKEAGQGLVIYKSEGGEGASSAAPVTFAPPPEQPQPRPTAPVTAQPIAPPPVATAAPSAAKSPAPVVAAPVAPAVQPAPVQAAAKSATPAPAASVPAKPAAVAARPAAKDEVGALLDSHPAQKTDPKAAKPAEAAKVETKKADAPKADVKTAEAHKAAAKPAEPAKAVAASGAGPLVQFGAFSSTALATSEWAKLVKAYPGDLTAKGDLVEPVERNGKTLYRAAVAGFPSRADAVAFCVKLKADGRACIVR